MATETVTQSLKAFDGWDSTIFMGWLNAMSDMMMTGGDGGLMDNETLKNYGGLMLQLGAAVEELHDRERATLKARTWPKADERS